MYSTCIHCRKSLGRNEGIEALPIGRRLAFDASKGRLWVICRACERWNLTPFHERWEAIEQSERAFRGTRVRVSTGNIGLARLADGTELIRVGAPLRPEFAAWRYGDQFGRRRNKAITNAVVGAAAAGLAIAGASLAGVSLAALLPIGHVISMFNLVNAVGRPQSALSLPDGGKFIPFGTARLIQRDSPEGWGIEIGHAGRWAAGMRREWASRSTYGDTGDPKQIPYAARLAFEMAVHEDAERLALEGELASLAKAWADAEQIAHIADNLLTSPQLQQKLDALKDETR